MTPPIGDADVRAALDRVVDPELDRPVTSLDFVQGVEIDGDVVTVRLRLPTYWCAPNFAWLMVSDAHDAVGALPGVGEARREGTANVASTISAASALRVPSGFLAL